MHNTSRGGHAPGYLREAFLDWLEEAHAGNELPAQVEMQDDGRQRPISWLLGRLWNCTDILPGDAFRLLRDGLYLDLRRTTYGAAAQALAARIR